MEREQLGQIAALSAQLGYSVAADLLERQFDELERSADHFLAVATKDGVVLGFAHASRYLDLIEPHWVEIAALVVDESARSEGLGASLVHAVEDWACSIGIRQVRVRSNILRERAHAFYQRLGYPITKTSHLFSKIVD